MFNKLFVCALFCLSALPVNAQYSPKTPSSPAMEEIVPKFVGLPKVNKLFKKTPRVDWKNREVVNAQIRVLSRGMDRNKGILRLTVTLDGITNTQRDDNIFPNTLFIRVTSPNFDSGWNMLSCVSKDEYNQLYDSLLNFELINPTNKDINCKIEFIWECFQENFNNQDQAGLFIYTDKWASREISLTVPKNPNALDNVKESLSFGEFTRPKNFFRVTDLK